MYIGMCRSTLSSDVHGLQEATPAKAEADEAAAGPPDETPVANGAVEGSEKTKKKKVSKLLHVLGSLHSTFLDMDCVPDLAYELESLPKMQLDHRPDVLSCACPLSLLDTTCSF